MPPLTDEQTRRNVIREWILGFPRDTIAEQNLASHYRLYNFFRNSGAAEEDIESFIANVSSSDIPPKKLFSMLTNYMPFQRNN